MTALMDATDVVVTFGHRNRAAKALDGVTLDWQPGEIHGLVGESGCGKSTLARTLLGLISPTSGSVALGGESIASRPTTKSLRKRVQMIFQDPYQTLNPRQKVGKIVAEPLVVQGVPRSEHAGRVDRALRDVNLDADQYLDRYPHQLSGGQRQRVAIAASLVLEPDGLVCDEPVSMLDVSVRTQIIRVLLGLRESRGLALLFITHDISLAWALCDRIAVMYLGRIVEEGVAVDVIERPQHPYTKALVAAVPSPTRGAAVIRDLPQGELPDAGAIPRGCRFHPRCPSRFEPCDSVDPPFFDRPDGHGRAACLLLDPAYAGAARTSP